jgi:hypothetical protein
MPERLEETLRDPARPQPALAENLQVDQPDQVHDRGGQDCGRHVKRWRNGKIVLRWTEARVLEAEKQVRRLNGYSDLQLLSLALEAAQPCRRSPRRKRWSSLRPAELRARALPSYRA